LLQKLEKVVPDQPKQSTPVHLRPRQVFAHQSIRYGDKPFIPGQVEESKST
jgi:NADH dehydrogenase (ubiquinone) 1 alpha subcomplex subunit 8